MPSARNARLWYPPAAITVTSLSPDGTVPARRRCTPSRQRSHQPKRKAVVETGGDRSHIVELGRNGSLPKGVVSPGDNGAISTQRKIVVPAGGDRDHIAESGRNRSLPKGVVSPGGNGAVSPQREAAGRAGGDRSHIAEPGRDRCLPLDVVSPCNNGAIVPQREIVKPARRSWSRRRVRRAP